MRAVPATLFIFPIALHPILFQFNPAPSPSSPLHSIPFQFNPVQSSSCHELLFKSLEGELTEKCIEFMNNEKQKDLPISISSWLFNKIAFGTCNSFFFFYLIMLHMSQCESDSQLGLHLCLPCPADGAFSGGLSRHFCRKAPVRRVHDNGNQGRVWQPEFCAEVSSSESSVFRCLTIVNMTGRISLGRQSFTGRQHITRQSRTQDQSWLTYCSPSPPWLIFHHKVKAQLKCPQTLFLYQILTVAAAEFLQGHTQAPNQY